MTETIEQHQSLLSSWRKMLEICLALQQELGEQRAPTNVAVGIVEARGEITRIKGLLRGWGEDAIDLPDEMTTADTGEIARNLHLLEIHRRTLAHYLHQMQMLGERDTPPMIINGLADVRRQIATLKRRLRQWNAPVTDVDGDT